MIGHIGHAVRSLVKFWKKRPFLVMFLLVLGVAAGFLAGSYAQAVGRFDIYTLLSALQI